jgi:hypothetical protein
MQLTAFTTVSFKIVLNCFNPTNKERDCHTFKLHNQVTISKCVWTLPRDMVSGWKGLE